MRSTQDICAAIWRVGDSLSLGKLVATKLASIERKIGLEDAVLGCRGAGIDSNAQNVWNICGRATNVLAR